MKEDNFNNWLTTSKKRDDILYAQIYPGISKSKYPIVYFNTPTLLQPDLLTGIFSNTLPDPTLKHPTRWALKIVNKQTKDFFTEDFLKKENQRQLRSATKKYWFNPTDVLGQ